MKIKKFIKFSMMATAIGYAASAKSSNELVIEGFFERTNVPGKFIYQDNADKSALHIEYYSPSLNKKLVYDVGKFDECSSMAMYKIPNTSQVVLDGSCASRDGQIYQYVYEWNTVEKNWCLIREITGEKQSLFSYNVTASKQILRVKNCTIPGSNEAISYQSNSEVALDIAEELRKFRNFEDAKDARDKYLSSIQYYDIYEFANYINSKNVQDINNLAFYLSEIGRSSDAIVLLEKIVNYFPTRTVAKLNLADSYWASGFKERAAGLYREYHDKTILSNSKSKIPSRVSDRMK